MSAQLLVTINVATNMLTKLAQIISDFLGYLEKAHFR